MSGHPGELLSAWLDGELAAAEAAVVASHVEACAVCAAERDEVEAGRAAVRGLPFLDPPAGVLEASPAVHLGDLLSARLDGEVDDDLLAGIDAHLAACPACAAEHDEVAWARATVRRLPRLDAPGGPLRPAAAGSATPVRRPPAATGSATLVGRPPAEVVRPRQLVAAAFAVAAAAAGILGLVGRPAPSDTSRPSVASFVSQHSTSSPGPDAVSGLAPAALPVSFSR